MLCVCVQVHVSNIHASREERHARPTTTIIIMVAKGWGVRGKEGNYS